MACARTTSNKGVSTKVQTGMNHGVVALEPLTHPQLHGPRVRPVGLPITTPKGTPKRETA